MAQILSDRHIKLLIGTVLTNADEKLISPNAIRLRLGDHVHFHSTGEEFDLEPGKYLVISPGESVAVSSMERIDFSPEIVNSKYPDKMLMGWITPTTTMMREGISQASTKADAGFRGNLNWTIRNGSTKDIKIAHGEALFKMTVFLLEGDEVPEIPYGERDEDKYMDTVGIARSTRQIPADLPESKIIKSSYTKMDPKVRLREAGYPFDHIGTELYKFDGKFEIITTDVKALTDKIQKETETLTEKIEGSHKSTLETVESILEKKIFLVARNIVGALVTIYGMLQFLQTNMKLKQQATSLVALFAGLGILFIPLLLSGKKNK